MLGRLVEQHHRVPSEQHARDAEALAKECGVPFHGAWLDAPAAVLEARVAGRSGDASDATVDVLRQQLARDLGPLDWAWVDAAGPTTAAGEAWLAGRR